MKLPRLRLEWAEPTVQSAPKALAAATVPDEPHPLADGRLRLVDLAYPEAVEFLRDAVRMGCDRWVRTYMVHALPGEVETMFLGVIFDHRDLPDLDLSVEVHPVPREQAERELTRGIRWLEGGIQTGTAARTGFGRDRLERLAADYERMRYSLSHEDALYHLLIAIQVGARTEAELLARCRILETEMKQRDIEIHPMYYRQLDAFAAAGPLPTKREVYDYKRNATRGSASACLPCLGGRWQDPDGMFIGVDAINGSPVIWSLWNDRINNANTLIIGRPGSGKSQLMKSIAVRMVAAGTQFAFIDHEGEYSPAFAHLGAETLRVDPDKPSGVNPCDISAEYDEDTRGLVVPVRRRCEEIGAWVALLLAGPSGRELPPERIAQATEAAQKMYEAAGITEDPESLFLPLGAGTGLYAGRQPRPRPQFSDFVAQMKALKADEATLSILGRYTKDGTRPMFDCPSRELRGPLLVVDVRRVSEDPHLQAVSMSAVLGWLWATLAGNNPNSPKAIAVDEAWRLTRQKQSADFLSKIARGARKRHIALVTATQFVREFLENKAAEDVLHFSPTRFIGGLSEEDAAAIRGLFDLSAGQSREIPHFGPGQFLLKSGQHATLLQAIVTPQEAEWYNTDPRKNAPQAPDPEEDAG